MASWYNKSSAAAGMPGWYRGDQDTRVVDIPQQNSWQYRNPTPYQWYEGEASNIPGTKENWWKGVPSSNGQAPKFEPKKYQAMLDQWKTLSTGWRAQSPTRYTPQAEESIMGSLSGTMAEQNRQLENQMANQFANRGMYGQGVQQAAQREAGQGAASKLANLASSVRNQMENQKYDDFRNWWADAQQRSDTAFNQKISEKQLALQQSMASAAMQPADSSWDWTGLVQPGVQMGMGALAML
jgi:hypothetical protein